MADRVTIGGGTRLLMSDESGSPGFIVINEIETIGAITEQRPEIQATPLSADAVRYIGGLKDGQPLEITGFLLTDDPSQDEIDGVKSVFDNNEPRTFIVQPPLTQSKQMRFDAVITSHSMGPFNAGDPMRRNITLRLASAVVMEANEHP